MEEEKGRKLEELLNHYGDSLSARYKRGTVLMRQGPVKHLSYFAKKKGIKEIEYITPQILIDFQRHLYEKRDFKYGTIKSFIYRIRLFFDYLIKLEVVRENPAKDLIILPKPQRPKERITRYYSLEELVRRYLREEKDRLSYLYLHQVEKHLKGFFSYLRTDGIQSVYKVTEAVILKYRRYLWKEWVQAQEGSLVPRTQIERLRSICRFFRYLDREGIINNNPTKNLGWEKYYKELLKKAKRIRRPQKPKVCLTPLDELKMKFLRYEKIKGKAPGTIYGYQKGLSVFFSFLKEKGLTSIAQVEKRALLDYYTYLHNYRGSRGQAVSQQTKARYLFAVRIFFRFLARFDFVEKDPSFDLEPIKEDRGLPKPAMTEREVFTVLEEPDLHTPLGLRNRTILEVLYSTAIRSNELRHLNIEDIDQSQGLVRINGAKGGRSFQRVIPIGRVALDYVSCYLREARPRLENGDRKALFLTYRGKRMDKDLAFNIVKRYTFETGIRKTISPHSFRVTCATHLLKNGADIRYVQEQLGHRSIRSTQIYTRLMPKDLKEVHSRCHPRERKNSH